MKNSFEVSMNFFRKIQQFFMSDFLHSKILKMKWICGMSRAARWIFFSELKEGKLFDDFLWLMFWINKNVFFTNGHYRSEGFWNCTKRTAPSAGSYNDDILYTHFRLKGRVLLNEFFFWNLPQWGEKVLLMRSFSFRIQLKILQWSFR